MPLTSSYPGCAQFDQFQLDLKSGVLQRSGVRVPVQTQPLQVLRLLLQAEGKVVTREELRKVLWPEDTFVDFELGVNTAVKKLRQALADPADRPKFIETLPKIGYRFLVPVEWVTEDGQEGITPKVQSSEPSNGIGVASVPENHGRAAHVESKRWVWIAAGIVVVAIGAALATLLKLPSAVPIVEAVTQLTDDGEPKSSFTKIVTDGVRVYFNEGTIGSLKITQVAVTGGQVAVVPTRVVDPYIGGLSPEGSALLATSHDGTLWQLPLPTGEPRRLGDIGLQDASFFPDGRILFGREGDLYLAEKDGSNPRKLVSIEGLIEQPSISPDGQRLVFTVWSGVPLIPMSIVESMADGSRLHPIVSSSEGAQVCRPEWGPDGRYILFQNRHEGRRDLWLLPMQAGFLQRTPKAIQLTNGPLSYTAPVMSRDGKQIFAVGAKERGELLRFDAKANEFVPFLSGISAFNPTFSRDGNWVAYTSYPDHALWRSRADGSERLQLTYPPMQVYYSFISPDGKQVAYGNAKGEIYVISIDGGQPQKVVEKDAIAANWSSDGNVLVFTKARDAVHFELQFLDLRTGKRSVVPGSQDLVGGQWVSENVLVASPGNNAKLEVFDVRTQKWSDLVPENAASVINWAHSPDYQYVYYTTGGAEPKAVRIRLADHKVETIASLKDLRRAPGPDGSTQISVAPDGSAIFTRDVGTQEIYALTLKWP
jgi:DNA-binding winged helix-turn-helix (wHTH) protein/Tol biopolymer transport system component